MIRRSSARSPQAARWHGCWARPENGCCCWTDRRKAPERFAAGCWPDAQRALAGFDLTLPKSVLVDPQIFSVKTIDAEAGLVRYYSRFYINADRRKFDRWLVSLVPETVDVLAARCRELARDGGGFVLSLDLPGGERVSVRARAVVGADGARSVVRRTFYPGRTDIQHYVAIQQWFRADDTVSPFYSCIFDPVTSESCSWSTRTAI